MGGNFNLIKIEIIYKVSKNSRIIIDKMTSFVVFCYKCE